MGESLTRAEANAARIALESTWNMQPDNESEPNAATRAWRKLRVLSDSTPGLSGAEQLQASSNHARERSPRNVGSGFGPAESDSKDET